MALRLVWFIRENDDDTIESRLYFYNANTRRQTKGEFFAQGIRYRCIFKILFESRLSNLHSFAQFAIPVKKKESRAISTNRKMSLDQTQVVESSSAITIFQHSRFRYFFVTLSPFFFLPFFFFHFCYYFLAVKTFKCCQRTDTIGVLSKCPLCSDEFRLDARDRGSAKEFQTREEIQIWKYS